MSRGALYLVPAWLCAETDPALSVPAGTLERVRALAAFVVEQPKSARRFLAACGHPKPLREVSMAVLDEHTPAGEVPRLLEPLLAGRDVGLLSEAGLPAVADPGARLVAAAHAAGIRVVPLPGASAILLALAASGLEGQRFRFAGYLPADSAGRRAAIAELERRSARERETQLFIETPYRNDAMLADLLATLASGTRLAVAASLTGPDEWIRMAPAAQWKASPAAIGKRPAMFLLLAGS